MSKIIDRISKLLKLAAGSEGHEAETAAAMARRLMVEHAVSMQDVEESNRPSDPIVKSTVVLSGLKTKTPVDVDHISYRCAWWKRELASAVGQYLDLRSTYTEGTNLWTFHGYQSDVEVALYLYEICARQIDKSCKDYLAKEKYQWMVWDSGLARKLSTEFRNSAVRGLRSKFSELKRTEAVNDPTGCALMRSRKSEVDAWFRDNISTRTPSNWGSKSAYSSAGYTAGRNVKLNAGVGQNTNRGSLSAVKGHIA